MANQNKKHINQTDKEKGKPVSAISEIINFKDQEFSAKKKAALSEAFEMNSEGFWNYNFDEDRFDCTNEAFDILEISKEKNQHDIRRFINKLHPSEKLKVKAILSQISKNVNDFNLTLRFTMSDGSSRYLAIKSKLKRNEVDQPLQLFGTFRDITEDYYQLQQLKENEELFRSLFNHLTDIFVIFEPVRDTDGAVVDYIYKNVNPIFEMKFDLPKKDIVNKPLSHQVQLFQQFHPLLKITAATREPQQNSFFLQSIDAFVDVLIYSPSENIIATIWRDVSLVVEASSALRENEEKYRQIFSIGKDGLFMIDFFSGKIIDVNPAGCSMFGFTKEQMVKMLFKECFTEKEQLESLILDEKATHINTIGIKQDGTEFPIEASLSYFNWSGRKVAVTSIRDISERAKTQKELIKSEKKFKQLFDFSNDAILIIKDYKITEYNQKSLQIFDLHDFELNNSTLWGLSPSMQSNGDNSRVKMLEMLQQAYQGDQLHFEWTFERSDKSEFYANIKLSSIFFENEKIIQAIIRDVSTQKLSEKALRQKEIRWKQSLEISSTGVWEWNVVSNEVFFSKVWKAMLGYEPNELENSFEEYEKHIHPEDVEYVYSSFENYFAIKEASLSINFRFRCKNGTYKWINCKGKIYSYNKEGKPEQFVGTHTDITRFILTEQKFKENQDKYRQSLRLSKMGFWELNLQTMIVNAPEETFKIFGLETNHATLKQIETLVHREDQQEFVAQFVQLNDDSNRNFNFRIIVENQTRYITSVAQELVNDKNKLVGFTGIFQDITSSKKDEQELKDDQKLIKSYLNKTSQAILSMQDDQIVFMNNRFAEITGFKTQEIEDNNFKLINQVVPEDKPYVQEFFDQINKKSNYDKNIEFRFETKSGRIKWLTMTFAFSEFRGREALIFIFEDITVQKNEAIKIAQEEQNQRNSIVHSPVGIALISRQEKITFSNNEFKSLVGFEPTRTSDIFLKDLLKPKDYNNTKKSLNDFLDKTKTELINEMQLTNGTWVKTKLIPAFDLRDEISHYILYFSNIDTIRKQIKSLTEQNLLQKLIINGLDSGIGIFDQSQKLTEFNQKLFVLFEIESRKDVIEFNHFINDPENQNNYFNKVLVEGQSVNYTFKTKGQKLLSVELTALRTDFQGIMIQSIDVTEKRNKENHLNMQLERFQSIFENTPIGIALLDKNRNIVNCNKKYSEILNYNPHELNDKRLDQLIQTEYLSTVITQYSELFANVIPRFNSTFQMADQSGQKRWINSTFTQLFDQYNEVSFAIHIIEDISDSKENEYALINKERLKTLNYLANSFAHQFNNKLMAMYGNSYLLKSHLKDQQLAKYAESLFETINNTSTITNNLLSFSGSNRYIKVVLNLPKLLREVIEQIDLPFNIEVQTNFDKKNEIVLGDSSMLQNTFYNLIQNAKEAMQTGGQLTVETRSVFFESTGSEITSVPEKGRYIRITISDTGSGINQHDFIRIFDPFFTTKSEIGNTGLGLTIANKTIAEHGGTIKIKSSDMGTECFVYLPQPEAETIQNIIQPDEQLIVKGSANIVIIDDEDVVRIITGELLEKLDYNVFSFARGSKALEFYKQNMNKIDLVLLDKHMPEMGGKEVYSKLKAMNPKVKVVLLTGFNIDNEIQQFFQNENSKIIQKPVSIEKLSKAISGLLLNSKN